jgi:hypothetical protein
MRVLRVLLLAVLAVISVVAFAVHHEQLFDARQLVPRLKPFDARVERVESCNGRGCVQTWVSVPAGDGSHRSRLEGDQGPVGRSLQIWAVGEESLEAFLSPDEPLERATRSWLILLLIAAPVPLGCLVLMGENAKGGPRPHAEN